MSAAVTPAGSKCRRLRWKGLFIEIEDDAEMMRQSDGPFWCTHTMNCLGPDGTVAGREECTPARRCFEPGIR
jgi:hypothetical protein